VNCSPHTRTTLVVVTLVCVLFPGVAGAQPAPRPLSILDVPFISQSEALCGGAAAAMILRFWGARGLDAESFAHLVDRSAGGIPTTRLVDELRSRGWNATGVAGDEDFIDSELARGRPVLTLIEDRPGTFHYVVIVASTPQAIVFHDPARAPFRVMEREPFARRWAATDRWMAVVVPAEPASSSPVAPPLVPGLAEGTSCSELMTTGITQAQAGQLDAAERNLTAALSCGGSASLRELAGLRLLQRRWPEVSELASAALAADPMDKYAWQLLATSRFIQNDPDGALRAWNRIEQPHVDLVVVGGLTRTRQRVVERLLAVPPKALLTPGLFDLSARRLKDLPSAMGTRLEFVPRSSGLAELRAHVVERPVMPTDVWSYAAIGLLAAARKEIGVSAGALTGGGERVTAGWRFWPGRPRVNLEVVAPARWGGLWGVDMFAERQPFSDDTFPTSRRAGAGLTVANWIRPWARVSARGGIDSWEGLGSYGVAGAELRFASARDRVIVGFDGAGWFGEDRFSSAAASVRLRSSNERRGRTFILRGGGATATSATPADLWLAGDTGTVRPALLRAHPIVDDGRLQSERLGRGIVHLSGETRQWWTLRSVIQLGAGVFVDAVRVERRADADGRGDIDVGGGLRLGFPGLDGVFRLDLGKGLRDGSTALSFVYEP
jgi:Papain-like cysteine protease AvrRpt2